METNNNGVSPLILFRLHRAHNRDCGGIVGDAAKFLNGPIDEGTTQLVPWGIWVSGYILFPWPFRRIVPHLNPDLCLRGEAVGGSRTRCSCTGIGMFAPGRDSDRARRWSSRANIHGPAILQSHFSYGLYGVVLQRLHRPDHHCRDLFGHEAAVCPEKVHNWGKRPTWLYRILSLGKQSPGPGKCGERPQVADDLRYSWHTRRRYSSWRRRHHLRRGQSPPQLAGGTLPTLVYRFCSNLGWRLVDLPDGRFAARCLVSGKLSRDC